MDPQMIFVLTLFAIAFPLLIWTLYSLLVLWMSSRFGPQSFRDTHREQVGLMKEFLRSKSILGVVLKGIEAMKNSPQP